MSTETTYHRLGDYIREVNVRNTDLAVTKLLGLSVDKKFIPSIANTIGTDMSTYKIVRKRQFVYIADTSRRGDKIAVALLSDDDKAIISSIYTVFEITDNEKLLPEYLMMWFRRPEFDRYARYKSHGSAREIFDWDEMCNIELPIPSIAQQQKTVSEYETLSHRIRLNEQLISKLEETAQALYRKMFVDGIDKENLPEGWKMGTLGDVAEIKAGGDAPQNVSDIKTDVFRYPIFANGYENDGLYGYTDLAKIHNPSITISARGTIGFCCIRKEPYVPIVRLIVVIPHEMNLLYYLGMYFKINKMEGDGSVQGQLTVPYLSQYKISIPSDDLLFSFNKMFERIDHSKTIHKQENEKTKELQSLLLARMGRKEEKR